MRVSNKTVADKRSFAYKFWLENPRAAGSEANDAIFKEFKSRMNIAQLYRLRADARKAVERDGASAVTNPVIPQDIQENVARKSAPVSPKVQSPVELPKEFLVAAAELIDYMRRNRIEGVEIHSSGAAKIRKLEAQEHQVHFGGRRANDPEPTVEIH